MSMVVPNPLPPDEDRGPILLGVMIVSLALAVTVIALRVWVRVNMIKKLGVDDWFMIAALPFMIVNQALSYASFPYGFGRHIYYLEPTDIMNAMKFNAIAQIFNIISFYLVKASIVLFLIRLITHVHKTKRIILWISFTILTIANLEATIVAIFQCQPLERQWNPTKPGHCWSRDVFQNSAYMLSGVTILTDIIYLIMPVVYLWDLQVPPKKKVAIFALLGVGSVSMGCSIAVIFWLRDLRLEMDVTYAILPLACLKFAELNIAVVVGCIPALQPLFRKMFGPGSTLPGYSGRSGQSGQLAQKASFKLSALKGSGSQPSEISRGSQCSDGDRCRLTGVKIENEFRVVREGEQQV
ncbi:hypothetical protein P154DRAFT_564076 [Amniculicola lignicola CBS 123094]|uniref:Rhodopsin domain-containing protein n=1 Tax=Amniculicola lignicola CBS 123094 TaxID=1392246 RepID=A0A6A5WCY4_9PLEO|nr:hypothetical protein P154DRAFT_564076 [Amniculicola lignicola CBS 123094]